MYFLKLTEYSLFHSFICSIIFLTHGVHQKKKLQDIQLKFREADDDESGDLDMSEIRKVLPLP